MSLLQRILGRPKAQPEWHRKRLLVVSKGTARVLHEHLDDGWEIEARTPNIIEGNTMGEYVHLKRRNPLAPNRADAA